MALAKQGERAQRELQGRLRRLNLDRGLSSGEAEATASQSAKRIVRAMSRAVDYKRTAIMAKRGYSQTIDVHIRGLKPDEDWIRHLVQWEGRSAVPAVKQRAIQLLSGVRTKPRKSMIESEAVRLVERIRTAWFVSKAGRPRGTTGFRRGRRDSEDNLPVFDASEVALSIRDVVEIAAEAILNHGGANIGFSNPTQTATLKAAVLILRPDAERSVDREIVSRSTD
jgi:hypothetical protein